MQRTGRSTKGSEPTKVIKRQRTEAKPQKKINHPHSYATANFKWSFSDCAWDHQGWQKMNAKTLAVDIISKLQGMETQTWQQIQSASGGKAIGNGSNNHTIPYKDLQAQRPQEYKYFLKNYARNFEKVFSLRLTGKERLIGVIDHAIFKIIWHDAMHEFF